MPTSPKEQRFLASLQKDILEFFELNDYRSYSINQIHKAFAIRDRKTKELYADLVQKLVIENRLIRQSDGNYRFDNESFQIEGRVDHVNARFAFVIPDDGSKDVWVATADLMNAKDGDRVRVQARRPSEKKKNDRPEGEVIEILERKSFEIVGVIQVTPHYSFLIPDSKKIYEDIYIPKTETLQANHLDKVIVEVTRWGTPGKKAEGRVIKILGKAGENETEMHSILAEFGLPYEFPEMVELAAEAISTEISKEEIKKRKDLRKILSFTIDPKDAKDFDDAISYQKLANGNTEIGVHIADVSHYVKPGSILDQEAFRRATSVYLVDRVVPMLPEKLSNGLCSLRPHEDKLTFSTLLEFDPNGIIVKEWFGRTVIHSDRRFAYEEAQVLIENEGEEIDAYEPVIKDLNRIAKKLRDHRFKHGSVNFETVEVKFELDENGTPLAVFPRERKDAHKLIEEFMLMANKKVAEYVHELKKTEPRNTMVYRVHEAPDPEKLRVFSAFAKKFGYQVSTEPKQVSQSFNALMENVEGKAEEHVLQSLAVRTMSKARYSTDAIGHFGLAFPFYSHFTSPIRRYPDVMTHRLLQLYLDKGASPERAPLEIQCKHCSDREKLAADAERASVKYKQVEYMSLHEPQVFDGIITGVTEFGIFVEIGETSCEGLVRMVDLNDDYYDLDKENYRIVGKSNGRVFSFGDAVKVKVRDTNLAKRTIDLELIGMKSGGDRFGNNRIRRREGRPANVIPRGKDRRNNIGRKRR
ncbi:ribonuclease R [Aquirufa nivalisilvae]|uniref:ribonuclease R n=1 Tax=Aquirufa nivalisilvae TaxID=2516557 RepID=UPI0022A968EC|nr:ribonuclease R [Aquirufa nivalisilvae]MCZ2481496.1 ribonuclease R [Aquirufa nivalisilvae]